MHTRYVRAWPGGCGYTKMGSNYAPTLWTQKVAEQHGCHQCLWLFGEDHEITEVIIDSSIHILPGFKPIDLSLPPGPFFSSSNLTPWQVGAMNLFILLAKEDGGRELVTPSLDTGVILPGVTRYLADMFHLINITPTPPGGRS